MKRSHELPLCLLKHAYEINNFDYCLPHLIDKYSEYKQYYVQARKDSRFIIMDNGLFENVNHTEEDLIEKINLIKPDVFITPDVWNNATQTLVNAKYWKNVMLKQLPSNTNLMAVIQATTIDEAETLYINLVDLGFKYIAFNHSSVLYESIFPHPDKLVSQMMGRILLINTLANKKIINKNIHHHLLGCSLYQEFAYYEYQPYIKSVDTSNPITYAIQYGNYDQAISPVLCKPTLKIDDIMEIELSDDKFSKIQNNIFDFEKNCFQWVE